MRICLIPLKVEIKNPVANLQHLEERLREVSRHHLDLVCLPECTLTGYVYEEEDLLRFAEPIPGPTTERMGKLAQQYGIFLCFGMLEASGSKVFDSAVLLDREGQILLRHRKIEEHPPFSLGEAVEAVETELGSLSVLICGDLFNEEVIKQVNPNVDLLIVLLARSFAGRSPDPDRWESEERQVYLHAVKAVGVSTALVNTLEVSTDDPAFGGALLADGEGCLLAESPHGTDEVLAYNLE